MKLAVSNFAWNNHNSDIMFDHLKTLNINNIEGVLSKIDSWENLTTNRILDYKNYLNSNGMLIPSLQSLFYNVECDSIFDKDKFLSHIKKLIFLSKTLSVNILVFGSPSLRKKVENWYPLLIGIFEEIDMLLEETNIQLVIEPNAKIYGGEFFHSVSEIVHFVEVNDFKNIKTMIDTHNILLEGNDPIVDFNEFYNYISHIHISENKLKPIENYDFHTTFSDEIKKLNYNKIITYEVNECNNIHTSIEEFNKIYK